MDNEQIIAAYAETAIRHAAIALLWQATDATEDGNGFPISDDDNGQLHGETQFADRVVDEVPYLTEAVTAFVTANFAVLKLARVTARQCGGDFILTANGHGAGFWDRGLDMPVGDEAALAAWRTSRDFSDPAFYTAWLAEHRPYPAQRPQDAGDYLTQATRGYSFDAEFALDSDGDVAWLCVENVVLADELGMAASDDGEPHSM
jgi:hypothetical protein